MRMRSARVWRRLSRSPASCGRIRPGFRALRKQVVIEVVIERAIGHRKREKPLDTVRPFATLSRSRGLNSAAECHPHTVEVTSSNLVAPTTSPREPYARHLVKTYIDQPSELAAGAGDARARRTSAVSSAR